MEQLTDIELSDVQSINIPFPLPLEQLIHDDLSIVMTFAFSRHALETYRKTKTHGELKYLDKVLFQIPEQRAVRAFVEIACLVRFLEHRANLSAYFESAGGYSVGRISHKDGTNKQLPLREMTNMIMHASDLRWNFDDPNAPKLICIGQNPDGWLTAEIELFALARFCAVLVS